MPFPQNLEELQAARYVYHRTEPCLICKNNVEIFTTPGMREISMDPMYHLLSPAVRHYETCNTHTNPVETPQARPAPKPSPEPQQAQDAARIDGIPMFGVSGHNVIAAGYDAVRGILRIRFPKATWDYRGVPEEKFVSLKKTPFADRYFTTSIKGKFTGVRVGE